MEKMINKKMFYCPLCESEHLMSDYLQEVFKKKPKTLWLSNMITHYRHYHIESWNKCWGSGGRHYRRGWFGNYDEEKFKVNERAKRQIIRKAKDYLKFHMIGIQDFALLQGNDVSTVALVNKVLKA